MDLKRLCVLSLNVRGIQNKEKISFFSWIRNQNVHIIMLQETYFSSGIIEKVNKEWKGKAIPNAGSNHSKGVFI